MKHYAHKQRVRFRTGDGCKYAEHKSVDDRRRFTMYKSENGCREKNGEGTVIFCE